MGFRLIEPQLFQHESPLRPQPWTLKEGRGETVMRKRVPTFCAGGAVTTELIPLAGAATPP